MLHSITVLKLLGIKINIYQVRLTFAMSKNYVLKIVSIFPNLVQHGILSHGSKSVTWYSKNTVE